MNYEELLIEADSNNLIKKKGEKINEQQKIKKNNDKNIYIQSATLNGKPLTKNWFRHGDISEGGTLEFIMGPKPSKWSQNGELPPSMSNNHR